jgi:hypothetical protein
MSTSEALRNSSFTRNRTHSSTPSTHTVPSCDVQGYWQVSPESACSCPTVVLQIRMLSGIPYPSRGSLGKHLVGPKHLRCTSAALAALVTCEAVLSFHCLTVVTGDTLCELRAAAAVRTGACVKQHVPRATVGHRREIVSVMVHRPTPHVRTAIISAMQHASIAASIWDPVVKMIYVQQPNGNYDRWLRSSVPPAPPYRKPVLARFRP